MKTKTQNDPVARSRSLHHKALETLRAEGCELSGLELWRKCVQLERLANAGAVASCNGENIRIVWPLFGPRDYDFSRDEKAWDNFTAVVTDCVRNIFGHVPAGFMVNSDARGHTLKIDGESGKVPAGMQTDWGRNGILAAEINS